MHFIYILNYVLIAAWFALLLGAVVDCARSNNRSKAAWIAAIVILPVLGSVLYFLFAHGRYVSEL